MHGKSKAIDAIGNDHTSVNNLLKKSSVFTKKPPYGVFFFTLI